MPTCPKCNHSWKQKRKRVKDDGIDMRMLPAGEVSPQFCSWYNCRKKLKKGDQVFMSVHYPLVYCSSHEGKWDKHKNTFKVLNFEEAYSCCAGFVSKRLTGYVNACGSVMRGAVV